MANTYTLIEAKTLGSNTASIEFTSIPSTYTDLCLMASIRTDRSAVVDDTTFSFNTSSANFTAKYLVGDGSAASSGSNSYYLLTNGNTATSNTFSNHSIYIPNYAGSNNKSFSVDSVSENNATAAYALLTAGLWSQTAAITAIKLQPFYGTNFLTNSTFYLYGISNS